MRMAGLAGRLFGVVVIALAFAVSAAAKEGAQAHLLGALPRHAASGSWITVRWTVDVPGGRGTRVPFGAIGTFVRLQGVDGAATSATASQKEGPPYSARIRVPRGGIHLIRFGLMGRSCGPAACSPSPIYFPLR
jgi:hypothetical protein